MFLYSKSECWAVALSPPLFISINVIVKFVHFNVSRLRKFLFVWLFVWKKIIHFGRRQKFHQCLRMVSFDQKTNDEQFIYCSTRSIGEKKCIWQLEIDTLNLSNEWGEKRDCAKWTSVEQIVPIDLKFNLQSVWVFDLNIAETAKWHSIHRFVCGMKCDTINKFAIRRWRQRRNEREVNIFPANNCSMLCSAIYLCAQYDQINLEICVNKRESWLHDVMDRTS